MCLPELDPRVVFQGYSPGPLSRPEVFLGRSSGEPKWYMQGASYMAVGLHGGISIRLGYVRNPGAIGVWAEETSRALGLTCGYLRLT